MATKETPSVRTESFIWDNLPKRQPLWISFNQGRTNLNENNLPRNYRCYRINQNRQDILISFFFLCLIFPNAWIILRESLSFLKFRFALLEQPRFQLLKSYESFMRESSLVFILRRKRCSLFFLSPLQFPLTPEKMSKRARELSQIVIWLREDVEKLRFASP